MKVVNGGDWFDRYGDMMPQSDAAVEQEPLFIQASSLKERDIEPMEWLIGSMIPANTVTLLSGDGGTGKSLLALNLAISVASGGKLPWLNMKPQQGRALYIGAEDDVKEMHRRINDMIWTRPEISWDDIEDLHLASLASRDALLASLDPRTGILTPSELWTRIMTKIEAERPRVVVLDTLADLYPGNENDRAQARQFIGQLRKAAVDFETTIVLLSHPSLSGMASGTGTSGNTAWNNSVRSRLYMQRVKDDGYEPDKSARKLTVMKSNYGETGTEILMNYDSGYFVAQKVEDSLDKQAIEAKAERVFLQLLDEFTKAGMFLSPAPSAQNGAAVKFANSNGHQGITKKQFRAAQDRLQLAGKIWIGTRGPASRQQQYIVKGSKPE
jgi:RecA-family ATPase